jgi:dihydroorotate dehydrogenase (NAD+) catalytic subunit
VYEIAQVVSVPILGTGGIATGRDCVEMLMAGAACIGVGSAIVSRGERVFSLILEELSIWLREHGIRSLEEVRGRAHRPAAGVWAPSNPPPIPTWDDEHAGN